MAQTDYISQKIEYAFLNSFKLVKDCSRWHRTPPPCVIQRWIFQDSPTSHRCFFSKTWGVNFPRRLVQYFWTAAVTDLFRIHVAAWKAQRSILKGPPFAQGPPQPRNFQNFCFAVDGFCPTSQKNDGWDTTAAHKQNQNKTKKTGEFHGHQRKFARLKSIRQGGWCCWECLRQQHQNHPTYHLSERPQLDGMWNLVPFLVPNQRVEVAGVSLKMRLWRMEKKSGKSIIDLWKKSARWKRWKIWMIIWAMKKSSYPGSLGDLLGMKYYPVLWRL